MELLPVIIPPLKSCLVIRLRKRSGDIDGASLIVHDISARKRREQDFAKISRFNQAVIDGADHLIITTDVQGIILSFNRAAEASLGYSAEELVGKLSPALFHDGDEVAQRARELTADGMPVEPGFEALVRPVRSQNGGDTREWTYVRKDGTRFPVLLTVSALRDAHGVITAFLGIATDISERKQVERMKREFVSTVSHELRTPLTSIRGALGLVIGKFSGSLPAKALQLLETANRNSERLTLLINDILDLEKIESGRLEFAFKAVDLVDIAGQAIIANESYGQ